MKLEVAPKSTEVELNWHDAKFYCQMLNVDGKGDWHFPTKEELDHMYQNREKYDFEKLWYWSSTEFNARSAWFQYFTNGYQYPNYKSSSGYVRAVRRLGI